MAERVPVPLLLSRSPSTWLSVGLGVLAVPAVAVWAVVTRPDIGPTVVGAVGLGLVLVLVALLWRRTYLEPERGLLVREVCGVWRRPVAWADAQDVRLQSVAGQVQLVVRGAGLRTPVRVAVLAVDLGGDRTQPAPLVRLLADEIERWAPRRGAVVCALRAHAEHVATGGEVRDSPLAQSQLSV